MSYTELHTGKLEIYTKNFDRNDFEHLFESENLQTDFDVLEDDFFFITDSEDSKKYVFNKGTLYKVKEWIEYNDTEYLQDTKKVGDEIHFTYLFYNGGTWEGELLEEGLDSL